MFHVRQIKCTSRARTKFTIIAVIEKVLTYILAKSRRMPQLTEKHGSE